MTRDDTDAARPGRRLPGGTGPWAVIAVGVVVAGVVAVVVRPLAPDLGAVPDPARWFGPSLLERIGAYRRPVRLAVVVGLLIDVTVPVATAVTPAGRRLVGRVVDAVGASRPARAATAVVVALVTATTLAQLPLGIWMHVHARAYGLSTQTLGAWAVDWGIELGVLLVITAVLALGCYRLLAVWPRRWALVASPLGVVTIAAATLGSPLVLEPLRFDVVALPDGPVRRELEAMLDTAGRPRSPLLVADASRRTTRQNAYVSGLFGTRRIVVYDTLLERRPSQVALIVAHELAHERNRDLPRAVLAGAAGWTLSCLAAHFVLRHRVRTGGQAAMADPRGAAMVVVVVVAVTVAGMPVASWISRRAEAAADLGAIQLTGAVADYCAAQRGLVERNLSDPAPPTWERLWWWTHPPAASRLELASRIGDGEGC